jgi:trehalose 6-phosphate phosphatase
MLLDYDGTLTPIRPRPEQAILAPKTRSLLERLAHQHRVVLLSGRDLKALRHLARPGRTIGMVGTHGAEGVNLRGFHPMNSARAARFRRQRNKAAVVLRRVYGNARGMEVEVKSLSVALHFRRARLSSLEEKDLIKAFRNLVRKATPPGEWVLQRGRKVLEWKPRGFNKGRAVREIRGKFPGWKVLVAGDDLTDLDAFRAAGRGAIRVGVGKSVPKIMCDRWFRGPGGFLRYLADFL